MFFDTDADTAKVLVRTGHFTPIPHGCKPHMRDIKSYGMLLDFVIATILVAILLTCCSFFRCHQCEIDSSAIITIATLLTHVLRSSINPRTPPPTKSSPG